MTERSHNFHIDDTFILWGSSPLLCLKGGKAKGGHKFPVMFDTLPESWMRDSEGQPAIVTQREEGARLASLDGRGN